MENDIEAVREVLLELAKKMVNNPDKVTVKIREEEDERGHVTVLGVSADDKDFGILIGTLGANAQALRKVIGVVAHRQVNRRVYVQIDAKPKKFLY